MKASLTALGAALALAAPAAAAGALGADSPFEPVTAAETRQTRPLAELGKLALRRGEFWRLCGSLSQRFLRETYRTPERCRTESVRHPSPPCKSCAYRLVEVFGLYEPESDRKLKRKTVDWFFTVTGDPAFKGVSELELRFKQVAGRWVLDDIFKVGRGG